MSNLDFAKFKKASSDESHTILRHEDGHTIKIAHKPLSQKMKKDLDKLPAYKADGGEIEDPKPFLGEDHEKEMKEKSSERDDLHKKIMEMHEAIMKMGQKFAQGGTANVEDNDVADQDTTPQAAPIGAAPVAQASPTQPSQDEMQTTDLQVPQELEKEINAPSPMEDFQNSYADAKAKNNSYLMDQDAKFEQDLVNGHIQPMSYQQLFANKDTLGKIGTLFGLLVSGAGSGLAHQQNAVLGMMNNEIQNDLQAQIHSKENAMNFVKLNQADLANKVGATSNLENAKSIGIANAQKQMLQVSMHDLLTKISKMPPQQQQKALAGLQAVYPTVKDRINNINDLNSAAMSALGINPFGGSQGNNQPVPSSQGTQKQQAQPAAQPSAQNDHILAPNAEQTLKNIAVSQRPDLAPFSAEIASQMADAQKADRAIDEIKRIFPRLTSEAQNPRGYLQRKAHTLSGIPMIGGAIEGVSKGFADLGAGGAYGSSAAQGAAQNRDYASDYGALEAQVRAALPGVSGDTLKEILEPSAPEQNDTSENSKTKLTNLINKIKANVKTDKLQMANMLRK